MIPERLMIDDVDGLRPGDLVLTRTKVAAFVRLLLGPERDQCWRTVTWSVNRRWSSTAYISWSYLREYAEEREGDERFGLFMLSRA